MNSREMESIADSFDSQLFADLGGNDLAQKLRAIAQRKRDIEAEWGMISKANCKHKEVWCDAYGRTWCEFCRVKLTETK